MQITDRQKYTIDTAIGLAGGKAAYVWARYTANSLYGKYFSKQAAKITKEENNEFWNAAKRAQNKNALIRDCVNIIDINENNFDRVASDILQKRKNLNNGKKRRFWQKRMSDEAYKEHLRVFASGRNACFSPAFSHVLVNKDKMGITTFHELGHAINFKCQGFKNLLARTRHGAARALPFVFGISLLIPKDREDKPTDNQTYKSLLEFKKYSGILASACLLPTVAEEGMASINAKKMGKEVLSPELLKKMNRMNLKAFCSYAVSMIFAGVGLTFANYIKDKITGPLPAKHEENDKNNKNDEVKTEPESDNQELIEK